MILAKVDTVAVPIALVGAAAKGLTLTFAVAMATLSLFSQDSLVSKAMETSGGLGDSLAWLMLVLGVLGWLDVLTFDLGRVLLFPKIGTHFRHGLCVGLYSVLSGMYLVSCFVALDPRVATSWILVVQYLLVGGFTSMLATALALESRDSGTFVF